MKHIFLVVCVLFCFFSFCLTASYPAENEKELSHHPSPEDSSQARQSSRPILPPSVPSGSSGISPTTSPHIAAPLGSPTAITMPSHPVPAPAHHIPYPPSTPARAVVPTGAFQAELPQVPIMANSIGEVINIGSEKDGTCWIEVKDTVFNQVVIIKIKDLKNTPIVKGRNIARFEDIKPGDVVNVIFRSEPEENLANFVTILTEEKIEIMEDESSSPLPPE